MPIPKLPLKVLNEGKLMLAVLSFEIIDISPTEVKLLKVILVKASLPLMLKEVPMEEMFCNPSKFGKLLANIETLLVMVVKNDRPDRSVIPGPLIIKLPFIVLQPLPL